MADRRPRLLLFWLLVAVLAGSAALLSLRAEPPPGQRSAAAEDSAPRRGALPRGGEGPAGEDLPAGRETPGALRAGRRAVLGAARRFLAAFGRYERGERSASLLAALRAACTDEFAAALLAAPPRLPAGRPPPPARLLWLELAPAARGAEVLVWGAQRRGDAVEGIAFRFQRRAGRWHASGVGE